MLKTSRRERSASSTRAVIGEGDDDFGLVGLDGVDLPLGAIQVAGEREQLEEEKPRPLVDRLGLDDGDLRVDRLGKLSPALKS